MKKIKLYTEVSYLLGLVLLAFGTALMELADFGMSMVVSPAYIAHVKVSEFWPGFTFGKAEYLLQALLLVLMIVALRRFKVSYIFSFATAFLYGNVLDVCIWLASGLPADGIGYRVLYFIIGMVLCSIGVACFFRTYIAPEVYELIVKEFSAKWGFKQGNCKTVYDCISCGVSVLLSFLFFGFGQFVGVKYGTIICALVNGQLIGLISKGMDRVFEDRDLLPFRSFFEK